MAVKIILLIERGLDQETILSQLDKQIFHLYMFIRCLCPKNEKLHLDSYFGPQYCNPHIIKRN